MYGMLTRIVVQPGKRSELLVQRHHRPGRLPHTQPSQCLPPLLRVARVEGERDTVAGQHIADLVGSRR